MIGAIILVTDRLHRTESIMIMILMMDLRERVCMYGSSVGGVSPHTGSLSWCHLFCQHTHKMYRENTHSKNRYVNVPVQKDVCMQKSNVGENKPPVQVEKQTQHTRFRTVGNPWSTQNPQLWGFSQRESSVLSAYWTCMRSTECVWKYKSLLVVQISNANIET